MKNKDCLIFQTHVAKPGAQLAFSKLNVEVGSRFDLKLLVDVTQAHIPTALFGMEPLCFNLKETNQEHVYVQKCAQHPGTLWPRNIDLPLLWFFNSNNAQYRYYWVMEYDVRFTGNWNYFFRCIRTKCVRPAGNNIIPLRISSGLGSLAYSEMS